MKYILILLLATLAFNLAAQNITFIPDTSLSGLNLQDPISLKTILPKFMEKIDYAGPGAKIFLINMDRTEIATLIFHSGSNADLIAEFTLNTFNDSAHSNEKSFNMNIDHFKTESNIKLGITKDRFIQIKGQSFITDKKDDKEILRFRIENYGTSAFLIRYGYPSYYANYEFEKNILSRVSFGFEYP